MVKFWFNLIGVTTYKPTYCIQGRSRGKIFIEANMSSTSPAMLLNVVLQGECFAPKFQKIYWDNCIICLNVAMVSEFETFSTVFTWSKADLIKEARRSHNRSVSCRPTSHTNIRFVTNDPYLGNDFKLQMYCFADYQSSVMYTCENFLN